MHPFRRASATLPSRMSSRAPSRDSSRRARRRAPHDAVRFIALLLLLLMAGAVFVAPALAAGSISGVILDESAVPVAGVSVHVLRSVDGGATYGPSGMGASDASGAYTVPTPGAGLYKVWFDDPLGNYVSEWWNNRPGGEEGADVIPLGDDTMFPWANAVLAGAGHAGGHVAAAGSGTPLENIRIDVFRWDDGAQDWRGFAMAMTDAAGDWSVGGLAAGQYRFHFRDEVGGIYGEQFFDHQRTMSSAHSVSIWPGMNADWIHADLEVGGLISGVVQDEGLTPIGGITVTAFVNDPPAGGWPGIQQTTTGPLGFYTLGPLAPGEYRLWFHGDPAWIAEWWDDMAAEWDAAAVPLESGSTPTCDATLSRAGAISGHVVADGTGDPVEGIEVSVECWVGWDYGGWEDRGPLATTDANGYYVIEGLVPGTYRVGFRDPGGSWASEWHDDTVYDRASDVTVSGGLTTDVDAALAPAGHIAGVVRDPDGNPIPGIEIAACRFMGEEAEEVWLWGWGARADDNGFFSVDGLAAGRYQIELSDPNGVYAVEVYADALNSGQGIDLEVTAGGTAWADPVLELGGRAYGQVVDASGQGIANVIVMWECWRDNEEGGGWEYYGDAWTDEQGDFSASGLKARPTVVEIQDHSGRYVGEWYDDVLDPGAATPVDVRGGATYNLGRIVLAEGAHVAGTVTAAGGGPALENIEVTVARWRDDWGDWDHFAGGQTDADGHYDVGGLAAGSYRVRFWDGSGAYAGEWFENAPDAWSGQDVTVTEGGTTTVDAALDEACIIEGHVTDGSANPLEGIETILYYRETGGEWAQHQLDNEERMFTDADGYFRLVGLPPRTYQLRLEDSGEPGTWAAEVFDGALVVGTGTDLDLAPGETRVVDPVLDRGGSLAGRLLEDQPPFTPLSFAFPMEIGVWAWVADASPEGGSWQWYAGYATGDGTDGYMHGANLAPGEYRIDINCWVGAYVPEWYDDAPDLEHAAPVTITAGAVTDLGVIYMTKSAMIYGTVTGPDGQPVAGVTVRKWTLFDGEWEPGYEFESWSDGFYLLGEMAGGTYRVEFDGRGIGLSREFWDGASSVYGASSIVLDPREDVYGIDAQLSACGALEGTVLIAGGDPAVGAPVQLAQWDEVAGRYVDIFDTAPPLTDENGRWRMDSVSPGTYRVTAGPTGAYAEGSVQGVVVDSEQTTTADITLPLGASISGTITDNLGLPVQTGVEAQAWSADVGKWRGVVIAESDANGDYTLGPLAPGTYRVYFGAPSESFPYNIEYWDNRFPAAAGDDIVVSEGEVVTGIDCAFGDASDVAPPSAPVVGGADADWHATPVELTFAASDADSGVEEYEYRVDGGAWRDGGGGAGDRAVIGAPADHSNDGAHSVEVRAVDFAANIGPSTTVEVKIDTTGPVVSDNDPGLWRRGPVTVALSAFDAGCGVVDHIEYAPTEDGPWTVGASFVLSTWRRGGGSGERTTWVRGIDGLGNASEPAPVAVYLDAKAPITTHDSDGLPHDTNVTVHLKLNDAHSGPGWTYYSLDGGMWMIGDAITIPALESGQNDGVHWIWFYSVDAVGNVEQTIHACSVTIDVP